MISFILAPFFTLQAFTFRVNGAVPATTDFDPAYFRTNALPVTLVGTLTNWAKLSTNSIPDLGTNTFTHDTSTPQVPLWNGGAWPGPWTNSFNTWDGYAYQSIQNDISTRTNAFLMYTELWPGNPLSDFFKIIINDPTDYGNGFYGVTLNPQMQGFGSDTTGALYGFGGGFALEADLHPSQNSGQGAAVLAFTYGGGCAVNYAVAAGNKLRNNQTNYSIACTSYVDDGTTNMAVNAGYFEVFSDKSDPAYTPSVVTADSRAIGYPLFTGRTNNGTITFQVSSSGLTAANAGFSSLAIDSFLTFTATGRTNTLGKVAVARFDGTTLTYVVKNNANTPVYTNTVSVGHATEIVQAGGAIVVTAGSASGTMSPF